MDIDNIGFAAVLGFAVLLALSDNGIPAITLVLGYALGCVIFGPHR